MSFSSNNQSSLPRINYFIRSANVRLVDQDSKQLGVFSITEAVRMAQEQGMDLVEVNGKSMPPVCKIMDFGKFKYDLKKNEKEAARKQRENTLGLKEVSVRPGIVEHDIKIKSEKYIQRWLTEGNKVKISVVFRGREAAFPEIGVEVMNKLLAYLKEGSYVMEEKVDISGAGISTTIIPANAVTPDKTP